MVERLHSDVGVILRSLRSAPIIHMGIGREKNLQEREGSCEQEKKNNPYTLSPEDRKRDQETSS